MSREKTEKFLSIGETINYERLRRGLKKVELSKMSGLTAKAIGLIEADRHVPKTTTLRAIARALDLPEDYFLKDNGNRSDHAIRRLHFYIDLNDGETLTDEELDAVRRKVLGFAHELIDFINSQRKKD